MERAGGQGALIGAVDLYTQALAACPTHVASSYARGAALNRLGVFDAAVEDYEAALALQQHEGATDGGLPKSSTSVTSLSLDTVLTPRGAGAPSASAVLGNTPRRSKFGVARCMGLPTSGLVPQLPLAHCGSRARQRVAPVIPFESLATPSARSALGATTPTRHLSAASSCSNTSFAAADELMFAGFATQPSNGMRGAAFGLGSDETDVRFDSNKTFANQQQHQHHQTQQQEHPPGTADFHHQRGYLHRRNGDLAAAIREYTTALSLDPNHFRALFNRGFCYDKMGDFDSAIDDYRAAAHVDPTNAFTHYNLGIALDRKGGGAEALEAAIAAFTIAIRLGPGNADFYHNRGFSKRKLGDYHGAVADYTTTLELQPRHFRALYNRGVARQRLGDVVGALEDFNTAIDVDPSNVTTWLNRAAAHEQMGNVDAAIADYTSALDLDCTVQLLTARGLLYDRAGRHDDAVRDLTAALECVAPATSSAVTSSSNGGHHMSATDADGSAHHHPHRGEAAALYHHRGFAHKNAARYEAAISDYSVAISLDPYCAAAYNNRGFAERKLGLFDLAIQDYTRALELQPEAQRTLSNRAYSYARRGDYSHAVADYQRVLEQDPDSVHALLNRGISLDRLGRTSEALADFDRVILLDPTNAIAHFNRANVREAAGDVAGAVSDFKATLDLDAASAAAAGVSGPRSHSTRHHSERAVSSGRDAAGTDAPAPAAGPSFSLDHGGIAPSDAHAAVRDAALARLTHGHTANNAHHSHQHHHTPGVPVLPARGPAATAAARILERAQSQLSRAAGGR
jgi:tetratricopeptide (TPR) repeat protein